MNNLAKLPTELNKLIWGFVGHEALQTPSGKVMGEFVFTITYDMENTTEFLDSCSLSWLKARSNRITKIFRDWYPIQRQLVTCRYPKLDIDEVLDWVFFPPLVRCFGCGGGVTMREYRLYDKKHCEICYGLEHGMVRLIDDSGYHCGECSGILTVEEWTYKEENNWRCWECMEAEIDNDETDEETDEDENLNIVLM